MNTNWNSLPGRMVHSRQEMAALGLEDLAYVKPVTEEGVSFFAIHSADGNRIGAAPSRDLAFAAIRQHDLEPISVH
jgi:hypothetical protein